MFVTTLFLKKLKKAKFPNNPMSYAVEGLPLVSVTLLNFTGAKFIGFRIQ